MSVLIKNGHIFTAVDDYVADILVDEGKVRAIGIDLDAQADRTIEAAGKYVIPGGVDPHTHLEFPFGGTVASDDFRTGPIAESQRRLRRWPWCCGVQRSISTRRRRSLSVTSAARVNRFEVTPVAISDIERIERGATTMPRVWNEPLAMAAPTSAIA